MHNIIRQLRPGSLDNLGLSETLRDLINTCQTQHSHLAIDLDLSGELNKLGENININVFRIVQESINNVIKHAEAKRITVKLHADAQGALALTIQDDGKGMEIAHVDQTNHFGLLGMRERVQALHGQFNIVSSLQKKARGTTISIVIPKALNT
jgi:signal transduction histidine kinase